MFWRKTIVCILLLFTSSLFAQQGSTEQLAIEYQKNGELDKAAKLFEEAYNKAPSPHLYRLYLDVLLAQNQFKDAEKLITKHLRQFPQTYTAQVDLGYVYMRAGDKSKADKQFKKLIESLPPNSYHISDVAVNFFQKGLSEYAIETFVTGREKIRDYNAFALDLALLYEQVNRLNDMAQEYIKALESNERNLSYIQQRLQTILSSDTEKAKATEIKKALLSEIQKHPENRLIQNFWISFLIQSQDFNMALTFAKAFDRRFNDEGQKVLEVAKIIAGQSSSDYIENPYQIAESAYQYVIAKGENSPHYYDARLSLLTLYYQQISSAVMVDERALANLEKEYEDLLNSFPISAQSVQLLREWAHISAFYKKDYAKADSLLNMAINIPQLPKHILAWCKLDLADIFLLSGEVWESTLLYSQVEKDFKHDEIGFEAKLRNARLSYYIGEFNWALAQLDVLRSATSKLIANDAMELSLLIRENNDPDSSYSNLALYSHADLLVYQHRYDEALFFLDSLRKRQFSHSLFDEVQMKRAQIYIKLKQPEKALEYLEDVYTNHADDLLADDALYLAARLCEEDLKQPFKAMALYEKLITEYSSSLYVTDARKRFRALRES